MNFAVRSIIIAALSAYGCGCTANIGSTNMTKHLPPGAQDPKLPHPGTIAAKYSWNHSEETWTVSDLPDSFIFRCFDEGGKRIGRANAAWCIPVVEIETVSVDENGNPVAPKDADSISISEYGPEHTFIEHTQSFPHLKRQRELDRQQQIPSKVDTAPSSFTPDRSNNTSANNQPPVADLRLSWLAKVKAWLGLA